jgi:hypothetical protein
VNKIEEKIIELAKWVRAEGAYCCKPDEVKDLAESHTARITMHCQHHNTYSFEVPYVDPVSKTEQLEDSDLMHRIARGIVRHFSSSSLLL